MDSSGQLQRKGTELIVDDEKMVLKVTKYMLESLDFDVETAHNGEEGLAKFKQKKYSLLFANNQKRSRCSSAAVTATPSSTDR
ncbi:MAG: response regulator [Candidatus Hydrogenedentota bacterium]